MKKAFAVLFLSVTFATTHAQTQTAATQLNPPTVTIREKLVELALHGPLVRGAEAEKQRAQHIVTREKAQWLNYVIVSINMNEVSLNTVDRSQLGNLYYPLWNVGINVPLGSFWSKASEVKIAKRGVEAADAKKEAAERSIRTLVLSKYEDFLMKRELLKLQNEIAEDDYAAFTQAEQKFSTGTITYEAYSAASKTYNAELVKKIMYERDLAVVKLEIEEIIGLRFDDVLSQYPQQ
ncbi:outer membrane efflux protein [Chitinophaga skermanii]|uniref:Outer membrane efflux protein n=1 Tax=Chitinophaga skermanii TaxID=331697 RepID=A0A327QZ38_9BACT|nr:TolC family protein [Chitinophaga skermanii]RAJ06937.1 outer membrane efflux protein [Chitinophaga skermanii]